MWSEGPSAGYRIAAGRTAHSIGLIRATLIASLTTPDDLARVESLAGEADVLEVRADLIGDVAIARLRDGFPGRLLFTLRSRSEGGEGETDPAARRARLLAAAEAGYDLVDLEADRDLDATLLAALAESRRLISWHGPALDLDGLRERTRALVSTPARWHKLVPAAAEAADGFPVLALLHSLGRSDLIAFASGEGAAWTRLLAPRLGAPVVYAAAGETAAAPGQPSLAVLRRDYGLPELPPAEKLFGIVSSRAHDSLSPRLHNGAYRDLGLPFLYLPFSVSRFGPFWLDVVDAPRFSVLATPLAGLSVTAPHKGAAAAVAGALSPLADFLDAVNTLVFHDGVWEGESTDGEGVVRALRGRGVDTAAVDVAVVGAGGAGCAAAWALSRVDARVVLVNRDKTRGEAVARHLRLPFLGLEEFQPERFPVIVHATSLGSEEGDALPFEPRRLADGAMVVDLVYRRDRPTPLVDAVRAHGRRAIDGREVLLGQAIPQFRVFTGHELPEEPARRRLGLEAEP